jgi:hypothetical protein
MQLAYDSPRRNPQPAVAERALLVVGCRRRHLRERERRQSSRIVTPSTMTYPHVVRFMSGAIELAGRGPTVVTR